jgi:hypothetical protein
MRHYILGGGGVEKLSCFEGSQAVPACPGRDKALGSDEGKALRIRLRYDQRKFEIRPNNI